ncbi:MAG: glycosyltransferase family 4 protein [Thiobacillus sp.]
MNETPQKSLRILLSAYACEPGKGSEPGVGWGWARALARRGHEVRVLTRRNNQAAIERGFDRLEPIIQERLHFLYYDLPRWASWWKKGGRGVHLYYMLWQWGAYLLAKQKHAEEKFDYVHHVTFVSIRQPSFMGELGIPFIFGPVAGGERAPWRLRSNFAWRGQVWDGVRDVFNALVRFDPLMWRTFSRAERIFVTSEETRDLIPRKFREKTQIHLAIALDSQEAATGEMSDARDVQAEEAFSPRILYVGNFLYFKGMRFGIQSFAALVKHYPHARLSMVGSGPYEQDWRQVTRNLGVEDKVEWIPRVKQSELASIYRNHDVFLFPSLHDSGGMVVLEAMQQGLPVVCMKLGGPGKLVNETCGIALDTSGHTVASITAELAVALVRILADRQALARLSAGARQRVLEFSWDRLADDIYAPIDLRVAASVAHYQPENGQPEKVK